MDAWDLVVDRNDLSRTELLERDVPVPGDGEVLLRVDRVGMTANNVTYALVGEAMRYWEFFPTAEGWGRLPLWGFADVEASEVQGIEPGTRFYGYLPSSSHLIVQPADVDPHGFKDASAHRQSLPSAYNVYPTTTGDPAYEREHEDFQILYRPLFITSFMLADMLEDEQWFDAGAIVFSSASSKTAYGTAFCIGRSERHPRLIGLTSNRNRAFTQALGCYDEVLAYEDVESLPPQTTVYADMAGDAGVRRRIHEHLGDRLVHDAVVGATHLDATLGSSSKELPGARPVFFFAPDRIRKRRNDWGPRGIETRFGEVWRSFVPVVAGWVDIVTTKGPDGLRDAWTETLAGRVDPKAGLVISM